MWFIKYGSIVYKVQAQFSKSIVINKDIVYKVVEQQNTILLYTPHPDLLQYNCDNEPAVHGKGRVKLSSIIELTKPDFWTILVGLVAASLIGVGVISVYTLFFESFKVSNKTIIHKST